MQLWARARSSQTAPTWAQRLPERTRVSQRVSSSKRSQTAAWTAANPSPCGLYHPLRIPPLQVPEPCCQCCKHAARTVSDSWDAERIRLSQHCEGQKNARPRSRILDHLMLLRGPRGPLAAILWSRTLERNMTLCSPSTCYLSVSRKSWRPILLA